MNLKLLGALISRYLLVHPIADASKITVLELASWLQDNPGEGKLAEEDTRRQKCPACDEGFLASVTRCTCGGSVLRCDMCGETFDAFNTCSQGLSCSGSASNLTHRSARGEQANPAEGERAPASPRWELVMTNNVAKRDFLAYGNFTDPITGMNFIVVRMPDNGSLWRKVASAVQRLIKPWKDEGEKSIYWNVDGDPKPEEHYLWNNQKSRRYEWADDVLKEVSR